MSTKSSETPDVWEDDWEKAADNQADSTPPPEKKVSSKVTKAQRRAQQAEFNRQLWAEAESPQTFHFLEARASEVPLKQEFKPSVTVLSRKPQLATRQSSSDAARAGVARLALSADGPIESDDEDEKPPEPTPEERQAIALKNREEKQRKYEEVRERLFGSPSATPSGASSRSATPPKSNEGRGKGKQRGSGNNRGLKRDSSSASSKSRQLYDLGSPSRPNAQRKQTGDRPGSEPKQPSQQPIRSPRGPDANQRGGFRNRGAKAS